MDKIKLLKKIHEIIWRNDDIMDQNDLFKLQELIDRELQQEAENGYLFLDRLGNGYIKNIIDIKERR